MQFFISQILDNSILCEIAEIIALLAFVCAGWISCSCVESCVARQSLHGKLAGLTEFIDTDSAHVHVDDVRSEAEADNGIADTAPLCALELLENYDLFGAAPGAWVVDTHDLEDDATHYVNLALSDVEADSGIADSAPLCALELFENYGLFGSAPGDWAVQSGLEEECEATDCVDLEVSAAPPLLQLPAALVLFESCSLFGATTGAWSVGDKLAGVLPEELEFTDRPTALPCAELFEKYNLLGAAAGTGMSETHA